MEMPEESGVESDRTVVYRPTVGKCKDGHVLIFCTRTVLTFLPKLSIGTWRCFLGLVSSPKVRKRVFFGKFDGNRRKVGEIRRTEGKLNAMHARY